jgi:hypothetical protein
MKKRKQIINFRQRAKIIILIALFCVSSISIFAQTTPPQPMQPPQPPRQPRVIRPKNLRTGKVYRNETGKPAEKSISVDAKVNISLCVSEGKLKINGWDRNEIRAFISEGSEVGFNVREKNKQNNAVWVMVIGFDPAKNEAADADECLSGEEIEIDVPRGAIVNVKGQASETMIDSVGRARVENVGGDIFLNNVTQGIDATTYEGDVTVEKSSGAMTLASTTGNIVAFDVSPSEIGDIFKAKTSSGAITLQQVEHRQMEVNSNSGSMKYSGLLKNGGQYTFGTLNGSMQLLIPEKSSCKINASFGYGAFNSEIPLQNVVKNANPKTQSLTASMGAGDATVSLRTYSGAILIRKQ